MEKIEKIFEVPEGIFMETNFMERIVFPEHISPWMEELDKTWDLLTEYQPYVLERSLNDLKTHRIRLRVVVEGTRKDVVPPIPPKAPKGRCHNCLDPISISIFKGGDWCSDDCRKALVKEEGNNLIKKSIDFNNEQMRLASQLYPNG